MAERLNYHKKFFPSNDVVFAVVFGERDLFCQLVSAVTGEDVDIVGNPYTQATLRERNALLESIRFDTFAQATNNKFFTVDIQRSYKEARLKRRTVFYACRAISTQNVDRMKYEDLKPVNISFILTEHEEPHPVRYVKLLYDDTHEQYDDLLEITLVFVKSLLRAHTDNNDLYTFARYFAIGSQEEADLFVAELGTTELGKELILVYNNAVANEKKLLAIQKSPYFTERLNEAQLEEERRYAIAAERSRWQAVIADKDAALADKDALIAKLRARLGEE